MANRVEGNTFVSGNQDGTETRYPLVGTISGQPVYQSPTNPDYIFGLRTAVTGEPAIGTSYGGGIATFSSGTYGNWVPLGSTASSSTPTTPTTPTDATQANQLTDQQFNEWLGTQNLSADQKSAITALYNAVGTNDQATADKVKAAIEAGTAYSDPYFKAQGALLTDALTRGMSNVDGDLAFNELSLSNRLKDIQDTIARSGEQLSFQHLQELKGLERQFGQDLNVLQNDMAARGFTSSSIRTKKEGILTDTFGDIRESANRSFQYQNENMNQQRTTAERDTALEVARLQELASRGKLDLLRSGEEKLGSSAMGELGYNGLVGGVGGELPRVQAQDALSFASSYVF